MTDPSRMKFGEALHLLTSPQRISKREYEPSKESNPWSEGFPVDCYSFWMSISCCGLFAIWTINIIWASSQRHQLSGTSSSTTIHVTTKDTSRSNDTRSSSER